MHIFDELKERGLIFQTTDEEALRKALEEGQVSYYTGYDPTADSLHLGHLVAILTSRRLQLAGHKPYALVGGATGLIGDPSFKDAERSLQTKDTVDGWVKSIQGQLSRFLDFENGENKAVMVNNYDWFGGMNVLTFLRDIGKHFSVNQMINKEAVKQRLNRDDQGISFTEFSYNLLQGYDFACLNKLHGVSLQIGGSDQWGNITSGIDLTRRLHQNQVFGLTVPLITKADGTKFGKTEGGAVWLDPEKTSPFDFFQYWRNVADSDVLKCIRMLTFLPLEEIDAMESWEGAQLNQAKEILAFELTKLVHGEDEANKAREASHALFAGGGDSAHMPTVELSSADFADGDMDILSLLVKTELAPSRSDARRAVEQGGVSVADEKVTDIKTAYNADSFGADGLVVKRGKKKFVKVVVK